MHKKNKNTHCRKMRLSGGGSRNDVVKARSRAEGAGEEHATEGAELTTRIDEGERGGFENF